jgi:hypothetical protein
MAGPMLRAGFKDESPSGTPMKWATKRYPPIVIPAISGLATDEVALKIT